MTDKVWVRDTPTQKASKSSPLKEKESYKWIEALSTIRSETPSDVEVICVCDREVNMSEFFVETQETPFVMRAAQDRVVDDVVGKLRALNVEVVDFSDAIERINWYRQRWHVEVYFKILKSGTKVEEVHFQTKERLGRSIALLSVIAWRLYWLTLFNRHKPETDCTQVLTEMEWKVLYCVAHKTNTLPKKLSTVSEVIVWIAKLGGFLGRKSDGKPGVPVIWRGWQRLSDISNTFALFHETGQNNDT